MKKIITLIIAPVIFLACNTAAKDPVEKADSANAAARDSMPKGEAVTDKQTADFLVQAAESSVAQTQLSELAFQKGLNKQLKDFGSKMMRDHGMMNEAIKALATGLQVTIPVAVSENNQKEMEALRAKDTKEFDKDLIKAMIEEHESEVNLFSKASTDVNNADVKSFVDNGLPQLKLHLDSLKLIQKMLK